MEREHISLPGSSEVTIQRAYLAGVPMQRRRHEPGADRRRHPGHLPEGPLPRYVGLPPAARARARAPPPRAPHRPAEPARATTREPPPRLPKTTHDADAANIRIDPFPLSKPVSNAPNDAADDVANQKDLRSRVHAD